MEELSEALLNREVDGILIDANAGGTQKDLFSKPSVRVGKVIDYQTAYGVVIGGDSMRLRHCFYGYMRSHQAEIFKWVEELVEPIKVRLKQGSWSTLSPECAHLPIILKLNMQYDKDQLSQKSNKNGRPQKSAIKKSTLANFLEQVNVLNSNSTQLSLSTKLLQCMWFIGVEQALKRIT